MLQRQPTSTLFPYTTLFRSKTENIEEAESLGISKLEEFSWKRRLDFAACVENSSSLHENRSEEHTSELQSLRHLVCRLLLEKKKTKGDSSSKTHETRNRRRL